MNSSALLNGTTPNGLLNGNGVDFMNGGLVTSDHLPIDSLQINNPSTSEQSPQLDSTPTASTSNQPEEASSSTSNQPEMSYDSQFPALGGSENGPAVKSAWFNAPLSNGFKSSNGNAVARVRSAKITESFTIPAEERRARGFGFENSKEAVESKTCAEISKQTGAAIEFYVSSDGALNFLITGKESQVQETKKKIASELQALAVQSVSIPREHYYQIIGKNANRLHELEQKTGTKIQFPKIDADPSETVKIRGAKENIEQAIHEIQLISAEILANSKEVVTIEREYHAFITGPYNETLQQLQQETGAKIHVPPFLVNKNDIVITGEQSAVNKAKKLILDIYEQKKANCTTVSMVIKKSQHKYIIGPKGSSLMEFFKSTGVSIEMPSDPTSEQIILRGEQDKIGPALALLYEKAHYVIEAEITVQDWIQKFILGHQGENFNRLRTEFMNVQVHFDSKSNLIKMNGPRHEIERAKEVFKQEVDRITSENKVRDLNVETRYLRFIIGKAGANIKKIREETGAQINLPEEGSTTPQPVRIIGSEEGINKAYDILNEIVQKAAKFESEVSKELLIEHRFHSQIIGQKGENIREIRDKYHVQINFPSANLKSDKVVITGDKKNVEECYKHLSELNKQLLNDNYRVELQINKLFHKTVLGKEGAKVRKIRKETETRIDIAPETSETSYITILGKRENVERARKLIQELEREDLNLVRQDIIIPHKHHNALIGANGRLIQSIEQDCDNVSINFPEAGSQSDKVTLRGTKEGVQKAKAQLLEYSKNMQLNSYEETLPCPRQFHKFIIGKGGANINQLRDKYSFRIARQSEGEGAHRDQITLIGIKEDVLKAKQELEKLITSLQNTIESTVQVPQKHHMHFVARKGQVIREISEDNNNVIISFPAKGATENQETVVLKGSKECVEAAKARILEIVENLDNQIEHKFEIEQVHHRHVLGYRASNLLNIEQKHNVKIHFPKKETEDTPAPSTDEERKARNTVTVVGRREHCEAAEKDLLALVPITIEMEVPYEFHGTIIGPKGQFLRNLRDEHGVDVSIPASDDKSNIIKITGTVSAVEIAKEVIADRVKDLQARNFKYELNVPFELHKKIIGKKGATINEIRNATDVRIFFPEKSLSSKDTVASEEAEVVQENGDEEPQVDDSRNKITIIGYEKNVKSAVRRINKIVKELQSQVSVQVKVPRENHSNLIGRKGATVRKIMTQFKVIIKFPSDDSELVTITGIDKDVEACKQHILQFIDEFEEDITEQYRAPKDFSVNQFSLRTGRHVEPLKNAKNSSESQNLGFFVRDAPWNQTSQASSAEKTEFPSMNVTGGDQNSTKVVWGPRSSA